MKNKIQSKAEPINIELVGFESIKFQAFGFVSDTDCEIDENGEYLGEEDDLDSENENQDEEIGQFIEIDNEGVDGDESKQERIAQDEEHRDPCSKNN